MDVSAADEHNVVPAKEISNHDEEDEAFADDNQIGDQADLAGGIVAEVMSEVTSSGFSGASLFSDEELKSRKSTGSSGMTKRVTENHEQEKTPKTPKSPKKASQPPANGKGPKASPKKSMKKPKRPKSPDPKINRSLTYTESLASMDDDEEAKSGQSKKPAKRKQNKVKVKSGQDFEADEHAENDQVLLDQELANDVFIAPEAPNSISEITTPSEVLPKSPTKKSFQSPKKTPKKTPKLKRNESKSQAKAQNSFELQDGENMEATENQQIDDFLVNEEKINAEENISKAKTTKNAFKKQNSLNAAQAQQRMKKLKKQMSLTLAREDLEHHELHPDDKMRAVADYIDANIAQMGSSPEKKGVGKARRGAGSTATSIRTQITENSTEGKKASSKGNGT